MPQKSVIIRLENALGGVVRPIEVGAFVDSDSLFLQLPAAIANRLDLEFTGQYRSITAADGVSVRCRYVGPVLIQLGSEKAFVGAVEHGDRIVLGSIPMTELALTVDPATGELTNDPRAWRINAVFAGEEPSFAS